MKQYFLLVLGFMSTTAYADLLPDYDVNCDAMLCHVADINPSKYPEQKGYFLRKVPKNIHQIWFGDRSRLDTSITNLWKAYAKRFGYTYTLWSENDDAVLKKFMKGKNFELMCQMRAEGNYWAASDILRVELIKQYGGVYIDCDFYPPKDENGYIDLNTIIDFHGLTLMTEHCGRNIGSGTAIFVANGLIISPPLNPVICSVVDQIYDNAMSFYEKKGGFYAMYATGPFLLNKVLSGCYNIVPCLYLKKFDMEM